MDQIRNPVSKSHSIAEFEQVANEGKDGDFIALSSSDGSVKKMSLNGRLGFFFQSSDVKDARNQAVKDAFLQSIKDSFGSSNFDAAEKKLNEVIGKDGRLRASDVKAVLDNVKARVQGGRIVGKGTAAAEKEVFISEVGRHHGQAAAENVKESLANKPAPTGNDYRSALKHLADIRHGGLYKDTSAKVNIQSGDLRLLLFKGDSLVKTADEVKAAVQDMASGTLRNKINLATPDELEAAIAPMIENLGFLPPGMDSARAIAETIIAARPQASTESVTVEYKDRDETKSLELPQSLSINGRAYGNPKFLAAGANGAVFRVTDSADATKTLVVKMAIGQGDKGLRSAIKEANAHDSIQTALPSTEAGRTGQSRIAKMQDVFMTPSGQILTVFEDASSGDLKNAIDVIHDKAKFSSTDQANVTRLFAKDLLVGLQAVQASGGLHMDVKPANILVNSKGVAMLADFGESRLASSSEVRAASPAYSDPMSYSSSYGSSQQDSVAAAITIGQLATGKIPDYVSVALKHYPEIVPTSLKNKLERKIVLSPFSENMVIQEFMQVNGGLANGPTSTGDAKLDKLINDLTHPDPSKRISIEAALNSPYFTEGALSEEAENKLRMKFVGAK